MEGSIFTSSFDGMGSSSQDVLGYFLMISSTSVTLSGLKCSSTFSDGVNREETGGQERGTAVDSRTARSLRMLLIFATKKSQHLSANILLDSAVGNDTDLVLPIRLANGLSANYKDIYYFREIQVEYKRLDLMNPCLLMIPGNCMSHVTTVTVTLFHSCVSFLIYLH